MKRLVALACILSALFVQIGPRPAAAVRTQAPWASVSAVQVSYDDGDKLHAQMRGIAFHLHLIGTDAPEITRWECLAFEAADRVHELIPAGSEFFVETGGTMEDQGGRTYAYAWVRSNGGWELLNEILIREGLAGFEAPAKGNGRYSLQLRAAAADAMQRRTGYRSACDGRLHNVDWRYRCLPVGESVIAYLESMNSGSVMVGAPIKGARALRSPDYDHAYLIGAFIEGQTENEVDQFGIWIVPDRMGHSGLEQTQATDGAAADFTPAIGSIGTVDPASTRGYDEVIDSVRAAV